MTEGAGESTRKVPTPGSVFGPYTIIESLGAGGMGEVFRARDAKLNRHVALKFLPEELSADEQLLARFQREAKLLALVTHPNIATIYSIEEEHEHPYLVLELVEGETLAKTLASGPLPIRDALRVCRDVAAALEAAHRKGIVHRDLKPANVMVTTDGVVKVLDFGIAKPMQFSQAAENLESTPSEELTITGTIIGTGPYMSPEQVRGKAAGRRADIWAFGCLLYQALTGKPAFGRDTLADTLTSILEREPDWGQLPSKTPDSIRRLLKRCVQKDPSQRLQAIGDARIEIEEAIRTPSATIKRPAAEAIPLWQLIAGGAAVLAVGVLIGTWLGGLGVEEGLPEPTVMDFAFDDGVLGLGRAPSIATSRNGTRFIVALHDGRSQQLYRRDLARPSEPVVGQSPGRWDPIPGTEGAEAPFFSWDGNRVGYFAHGLLHWVPYDGSAAPQELAEAPEPYGGAWAQDGTIYFSSNQSLWTARVGTDGAERFIEFDPETGEFGLRWPSLLPDGQTLIYTSWAGAGSSETSVRVFPVRGESPTLLSNAGYARYSPSGHLVFTRGTRLFAIPFDHESAETTGAEFSLDDDVLVRADIGVPFFALAAESGTLVSAPGGILTPGPVLARMDATGPSVPEPIVGPDDAMLYYPRLSPDGDQIAITMDDGSGEEGQGTAGLLDVTRGLVEPLVANTGTYAPEWNPSGETNELAYTAPETYAVYAKAVFTLGEGRKLAEGGVDPQTLATTYPLPTGWSSDGVLFLTLQTQSIDFETEDASVDHDVYYLDMRSDGAEPEPFLVGTNQEYGAVPSPDGNWVAYVRREAEGQPTQVRIAAFPRGEPDRPESTGTGVNCQEPAWSARGNQLFFRCETEMRVANIQTAPDLDVSDPRTVWDWPFALDAASIKANYAYDPVSEQLLMVSDDPIVTATHLDVVLDWHGTLVGPQGR